MANVKKGDTVELKIEGLSYGGRGLGKYEGMVIFVPDVVPGDVVAAHIYRRKSNYAEASVKEYIERSPLRVTPRCSHHDTCGGCVWQTIPYEKQLIFKESILTSVLEHLGGQSNLDVKPIIPSPDVWYYRNKMEFTFGKNDAGEAIVGLHSAGSYHQVVEITECHIHPPAFNSIIKVVRDFAGRHELEPYDNRTHEGLLRHLVIRHSRYTDEVVVILLTADTTPEIIKQLPDEIKKKVPGLKGFMWGLNTRVSDVARADRIIYSWGDPYLVEHIGEKEFRVSAFSFFQTNTGATERLYSTIRDFTDLSGKEVVLDAFCGTGTIGIYCADLCRHVYGIELIAQAVWDARANARLNGLENCTFLAGDIFKTLPLVKNVAERHISCLVVDPPRGGMGKKALRALAHLKAPTVIYVSCNPTTLARDLQYFSNTGYTLETIQPVDMFPHTYHIESVTRMTLAENDRE